MAIADTQPSVTSIADKLATGNTLEVMVTPLTFVSLAQLLGHRSRNASFAISHLLSPVKQTILSEMVTIAGLPCLATFVAELGTTKAAVKLLVRFQADTVANKLT